MGNPEFGTSIGHIDYAAVAQAMGARGFKAAPLAELKPTIQAWLVAPGTAVLDVAVDAEEEPMSPNKEAV